MNYPLSMIPTVTAWQQAKEVTEVLKALYEVGLPQLLKSDVMITLSTPKDYSLYDLLEQINKDHHNDPKAFERALKQLKREFKIYTHHLQRKG